MLALYIARRDRTYAVLMLAAVLVTATAAMPLIHSRSGLSTLNQRRRDIPDLNNLPLVFQPALTRAAKPAGFMAYSAAGTLLFRPSTVVLRLRDTTACSGREQAKGCSPDTEQASKLSTLQLQFLGSNPDVSIEGGETLPGTVNYLRGNDPANWRTGLPTYGAIAYKELYPGITLRYTGAAQALKGTYEVAPGADPHSIRWRYEGAESVSLDAQGNLLIALAEKAGAGPRTITESAPVAWQVSGPGKVPVLMGYVIYPDLTIGFTPAHYDAALPLTIDPTLAYSTYLGGAARDGGAGIAVDSQGNAYVVGLTDSADFPLHNPLQPNYGGDTDIFIAKLNPQGTGLVYSTYLGGSGNEDSWCLAIDSTGSAYVTGWTHSTDFPTLNPIQPTNDGGEDVFVTKINAAGSALVYSTYLGGQGDDQSWGIAVHGTNAYITGNTYSTDFPLAVAIQPTIHGLRDIFVTKLNTAGSALDYSTYLGGDQLDDSLGIAVDAQGNAYVSGGSYSANYPVVNAYQPIKRGDRDIVISKLNPQGTALVYSTFLGGDGDDLTWALAVSPGGDAYLTGFTGSTDFPLRHPVQAVKGPYTDGFAARLSSTGGWLVYSTFLGGNGLYDAGYGIAVDSAGKAYISGITESTDFPTALPLQPNSAGNDEVFLTVLPDWGAPLLFSTYLGGSQGDFGYGVAVDAQFNLYTTGTAKSADFPTANPLQPTYGGADDGIVLKVTGLEGISTSPVVCFVSFSDVPEGSTFYPYVHYLACDGTINGYSDGTFRPGNDVTRGQLAKIASNAAAFNDPVSTQHFEDVPPDSPFFPFVERLFMRGIVSGYGCGGADEPCMVPDNRPYFRPGESVTRSQTAKIVAATAFVPEPAQGPQTFQDVAPDHPFFRWIEAMAAADTISGYECGSPGEPCVAPDNRPYFRPGSNVTRGQASKIVAHTFGAEWLQGAPADKTSTGEQAHKP